VRLINGLLLRGSGALLLLSPLPIRSRPSSGVARLLPSDLGSNRRLKILCSASRVSPESAGLAPTRAHRSPPRALDQECRRASAWIRPGWAGPCQNRPSPCSIRVRGRRETRADIRVRRNLRQRQVVPIPRRWQKAAHPKGRGRPVLPAREWCPWPPPSYVFVGDWDRRVRVGGEPMRLA
jgi:hypothetical protein